MIDSSLAYAFFLVSGLIHASSPNLVRSSARILRTISSARALASGLKFFRTYACPSTSPKAWSVNPRHRFQRGRISDTPRRTVELKRKLSWTNGELRAGAAFETSIHRKYSRQASTGAD